MVTAGTIAFFILLAALAVSLLIALTLYYHWVRYGVGIVGTFLVMICYGAGLAVLLIMALGLYAQL